jgi:hypothetical protein
VNQKSYCRDKYLSPNPLTGGRKVIIIVVCRTVGASGDRKKDQENSLTGRREVIIMMVPIGAQTKEI